MCKHKEICLKCKHNYEDLTKFEKFESFLIFFVYGIMFFIIGFILGLKVY